MDDFVNPDKSGDAGSADARNGNEDGPLVRFTAFVSNRRLSKHYKRKPDGDLETLSGTQFSSGGYYVCEIPAAGVTGPSILATVGQVIDKLSSKQAIGLGVPLNGTITGTIVTKAQHAKGNITAIPRSLDHFGWPGLGLLLLDGDDIDGLPEILSELYPPFAEVAVLVRPSASASVINPKTKQKLKAGEHCYVVIDDPSLSDACLKALMRLAWVRGKDKGAGWLMLSKRGDTLVRGPIDACVGSPERLSYEGEAVIDDGISRLPRVSKVVGGSGMLCARDLVAFADQHAPEDQYQALVAEAKADPEFCKRRDAAKVAYRGEHVAKAVKRGIPREKAEKAYDESIAAGSATIGDAHLDAADGRPCAVHARRQGVHGRRHQDGPDEVPRHGMCRSGRGDGLPVDAIARSSTPTASRSRFTPGHTATPLPMSRRSTTRPGQSCLRASPACRPSPASRRRHSRRTPSRWTSRSGTSTRCATRRSGASGTYGTASAGSRTASARSSTWRGRSAARSR